VIRNGHQIAGLQARIYPARGVRQYQRPHPQPGQDADRADDPPEVGPR